MKKLKLSILGLMCCLFLSGCGCGREEFVVTFDSDGGTPVESQTIEKGEKVSVPTNPEKEGFVFDGWYIDLDGEKFDFDTKIDKDIKLTAKWVKGTSGDTEDKDDEDDNKDEDKKVCNLTCEDGYVLVDGDTENCKCVKSTVNVTSVKLNKTSVSLTVGDTTTITATVNPSNASNKTVTWKSSNEKVATVKNGKITAIGEGTATITATAGGKNSTVKVTVISKDQANLNAALNSITAKTITTGNTNINYAYNGCTIENTSNVANNSETVVDKGLVKTLYRAATNGTISSTYKVTCGSKTETKTIKHTVPASTYTYTATYTGILYVINVSGATNYTLFSNSVANLKYLEAAKGVQTPAHVPGTEYKMVLNSDANTIYTVKSAQ